MVTRNLRLVLGPDVVLAHQPSHTVASNLVVLGLQAGVHAWAAVDPPALAVDRLDLRDQGPLLGRPPALRPPQPIVEATSTTPSLFGENVGESAC